MLDSLDRLDEIMKSPRRSRDEPHFVSDRKATVIWNKSDKNEDNTTLLAVVKDLDIDLEKFSNVVRNFNLLKTDYPPRPGVGYYANMAKCPTRLCYDGRKLKIGVYRKPYASASKDIRAILSALGVL